MQKKWLLLAIFSLLLMKYAVCDEPTSCEVVSTVTVPEPSDKAMQYYYSGNILWGVDQLWSLLFPLIILCTGFSQKIRKLAEKIGRNTWLGTLFSYLTIYLLLYTAISFPLTFYESYIRPHAYDLSTQDFVRWLDLFYKDFLVMLVTSLAFIWIPYLIIRKSPKRWWVYVALLSLPFMIFTSFIKPIWVDPLFNKFYPIKNKALEEQILSLAHRAGIEHGRVFEVDKSADTKTLNAYVTGVGKTTRIVLWDTIIEQLPTDQLLFVMGHEMGHYILKHIWMDIFLSVFFVFLILFLTNRLAHKAMSRYQKRFGFKTLSDPASFPLLLFLFTAFNLLFSPLMNYTSRWMEHEADRFGLEITRDNPAAAKAFVKLQSQNLSNPRPGLLYIIWRMSHPPLGERIDFANTYRPWCEDKPLKYSRYFKEDQ